MSKENEASSMQMEFNNAQYALDTKEKCEKKLQKIKIGLIIAVADEAVWILFYVLFGVFRVSSDFWANTLGIIAFGGTIFAYIFGGGIKMTLQEAWSVAKKAGRFGWRVVPFPYDILTGITVTVFVIVCVLAVIVYVPLILVCNNFSQIKKKIKAADEYLAYCTPANPS